LDEKKGQDYNFSSTQIDIPTKIARKIIKWGKENLPNDILYTKDNEFGRENEIHVTVLYGLHTNDVQDVMKTLKNEKAVNVRLGTISLFDTNPDYDVVKIDVKSAPLHRLHKKLKKELKHTSSFPVYHPHVTIGYVKKGSCSHLSQNKEFAGISFTSNEVIFSPAKGEKTEVFLKF
jgi:2'-5' RNA ligase